MISIKRSLIPLMSPAGISIMLICFASCRDKPPSDPCCTLVDLPQGVAAKSGQGAVLVEGGTSATYYVMDAAGKQLGYETLNKPLALDPGKYQVKVNNSFHPVEVKDGMLSKCGTGTLTVNGSTAETYYVVDTLGTQLSYDLLGKATSLFASPVNAKINNSMTRAAVKLNEATTIETGTMLVHGTTDETYYALDAKTGEQLSYNTLEKPLAFLPGTYTVKLNNTTVNVDIAGARLTELVSGTLVVHGTTGETYYVLDANGTQLAYNLLEKPLAFLPGSYFAKLNNTRTKADITGGQLTNLVAGTVLVKGLTEETYYAIDSSGSQLAYQTLNKPLAFFPGRIAIKVNGTAMNVEVAGLKITELVTGAFMVTGTGSDTYYILDAAGSQLGYQTINKALSFFPGDYTVRLNKSTRKATVTAGRQSTVAAFK